MIVKKNEKCVYPAVMLWGDLLGHIVFKCEKNVTDLTD